MYSGGYDVCDVTLSFSECASTPGKLTKTGFVHARKSEIQGLFKDIQGHVSQYQQIQGLNTQY